MVTPCRFPALFEIKTLSRPPDFVAITFILGYGFLIRAFHKLLGNFLAASRTYNFVRVCPNYKQDKISLYSKYTKAGTITSTTLICLKV